MLVLNLKTYTQSTGEKLERLLDIVTEVLQEEGAGVAKNVYIAPQIIELIKVREQYAQLQLVAQHVDAVDPGRTTGWIPTDNLLANGIEYSIYNHSEHRIPVLKIDELQSKGVKLLVCCETPDEAHDILENSKPYAVVYEARDLIGSGVSVTTRPYSVKDFVRYAKGKTIPIVGAGVSNAEDIKTALDLGAEGVMLASAFVKASDPKTALEELLLPFKIRT